MSLKHYSPFNASHWKGRTDSHIDEDAFRLHQVVREFDLNRPVKIEFDGVVFCLLGFASDEGVVRNKGRKGAAEAPIFIRKQLANLPANFIGKALLFDAGNIDVNENDLEQAQNDLSKAVQIILENGMFPLVLGGGHEIVLGHFNGIDAFLSNSRKSPLIINFDAHFDLRPVSNYGSSGTMFVQIADRMIHDSRNFDYLVVGLQTYANTKSLYRTADDLGVNYIHSKDILLTNKIPVLNKILDHIESHEDIYLTLDFDVLNAANAPGVSAPQPFGMDPEIFLFLVKGILKTGKVRSIDIAEISPRYDDDNRTSKLAAVTLFAIMNELINLHRKS
ncbi:MAG: formimidoylglutamase [Bacteroidota bacterium]